MLGLDWNNFCFFYVLFFILSKHNYHMQKVFLLSKPYMNLRIALFLFTEKIYKFKINCSSHPNYDKIKIIRSIWKRVRL